MKSNTKVQLANIGLISRPLVVWSFFIFFAVYLFNLPYVFFDGLIHDDAFWFYEATEGDIFTGGRGNVSVLVPYMDSLYAKGMMYLGTDLLRFIYIGVMALASVSAYFFYRNVLLIKDVIAVPASVIPNILPSLMIPLGFNASYAIWQLAPFYLSLVCLYESSKTESLMPRTLYWSAFLLFCITLNISVAGTFLIPSAILIFILFLEKEKIQKTFIKSLPFLLIGIYHLYKHSKYSHKEPVLNSIDVILDRGYQFIEMANFLLIDDDLGVWVIFALSVLGLIVMFDNKHNVAVFAIKTPKAHSLFVIVWTLLWLGANSVAYLIFSPSFRPNDYAYVFNYGSVLLMLIGTVSCLHLLGRYLPFRIFNGRQGVLFIVVAVLFVGSQRIYAYYDSAEISKAENTSNELRLLLSELELPKGSQLIILGVDVPHKGVDKVNSGYVRYLTGRNDLRALIGNDRFPLDPFGTSGSWMNPMKNLDVAKPVISFRRTSKGIERVKYLLQTTVNNGGFPRFVWHLYDISNEQYPPLIVKEGNGAGSYVEYINNVFVGDEPFVAFSPELPTDKILNEERALALNKKNETFEQLVNYSNVVTLFDIQEVYIKEKAHLQVLIRINKVPKYNFKLGYKISGIKGIYTLDSTDYLVKGDYLIFYHPLQDTKNKLLAQNLQFYNTGVWPYKEISLVGESAGM